VTFLNQMSSPAPIDMQTSMSLDLPTFSPPPKSLQSELNDINHPPPAPSTHPIADMQDTIEKLRRYTHLCENRIRELHPDHPLPVLSLHLGAPLSSAPPLNSLPLLFKHVPSYVLSASAATQKQERKDRDMIMELRRQREHEEQRGAELTKQVRRGLRLERNVGRRAAWLHN